MMPIPIESPHRIILANKSRLMREMFSRAIAKSPYLKIVGEVTQGNELVSLVEQRDAQWVIMSLLPDGGIPASARNLLTELPSVAVIAVAPDGSGIRIGWAERNEKATRQASNGRSVELHWTAPHDKLLENLSLEQLIVVLRKGSLWEQAVRESEGKDQAAKNSQ